MANGMPLMRINPDTLVQEWYTWDLNPITEAQAIAIVQNLSAPIVVAQNVKERLADALAANTLYLADSTPSPSQQKAQLFALTRQSDSFIRLLLEALDSEDGT